MNIYLSFDSNFSKHPKGQGRSFNGGYMLYKQVNEINIYLKESRSQLRNLRSFIVEITPSKSYFSLKKSVQCANVPEALIPWLEKEISKIPLLLIIFSYLGSITVQNLKRLLGR